MKIKVKIIGFEYVNEIESYWSNDDYLQLLEEFGFADADSVKDGELKDMLYMAMTDFEPNEAAEKLLTYKLSEQLNAGQIQSLSHEMIVDKVAEEYPEPELHYDLFNINQLLFKAFNGVFPNTEASIIEIELDKGKLAELEITEEIMTKAFSGCLSDKSLLKRLYSEQIEGSVKFEDAAKFIWQLTKVKEGAYNLLTSRYWIDKEDIVHSENDTTIVLFEEEED